MKKIRNRVFETNSSSSHSISISSGSFGVLETIEPNEDGVIILKGGEFGWEEATYRYAWTKANYCAVDCHGDADMEQMLVDVIKEHTGAKDVILDIHTDWSLNNNSYIDHQSQGTSYEAFESKELLKQFIFNRNSYLETDNDNH